MMRQSRVWLLAGALIATVLLAVAVAWPDATKGTVDPWSLSWLAKVAQAQTPETAVQLEWLGWQFFRVTTPRGKVILFNPSLNDSRAAFKNQESPLNLDGIETAHLILATSGHADDQGMTVEIAQKTGASVITTFELASWMVGRGVDSAKILRAQPGSRFEVDGIKIQVVNSVHGSGAPPLQGQTAAVYGGPALGFVVTLENGVRIYHAGSTALTMELQLYGRLYQPHVALLPIASGMVPEEAALAAEFLQTGNPNLHSVFPQHHASFMPLNLRGAAFVREVMARPALRDKVTPFDPKPGQVFLITTSSTRAR